MLRSTGGIRSSRQLSAWLRIRSSIRSRLSTVPRTSIWAYSKASLTRFLRWLKSSRSSGVGNARFFSSEAASRARYSERSNVLKMWGSGLPPKSLW